LSLTYGASSSSIDTASADGRASLGRILLQVNELLFSADQIRKISSSTSRDRELAIGTQLGYLFDLYNPTRFDHGLFRVDVMIQEPLGSERVNRLKAEFESKKDISLL